MENKEKGWGGARTGAGRKRMGDIPRVTMACSVNPATKGALYARAGELGISVGMMLDRLVSDGALMRLS